MHRDSRTEQISSFVDAVRSSRFERVGAALVWRRCVWAGLELRKQTPHGTLPGPPTVPPRQTAQPANEYRSEEIGVSGWQRSERSKATHKAPGFTVMANHRGPEVSASALRASCPPPPAYR